MPGASPLLLRSCGHGGPFVVRSADAEPEDEQPWIHGERKSTIPGMKKPLALPLIAVLALAGCSSSSDIAMTTCVKQWAITAEQWAEMDTPLALRDSGEEVTPEELCAAEREESADFEGFWSDESKWLPVQQGLRGDQ